VRISLPGEDVIANNIHLPLKMTAQLSLMSNSRASCVLQDAQANCVKVFTKDRIITNPVERQTNKTAIKVERDIIML